MTLGGVLLAQEPLAKGGACLNGFGLWFMAGLGPSFWDIHRGILLWLASDLGNMTPELTRSLAHRRCTLGIGTTNIEAQLFHRKLQAFDPECEFKSL